MSVKYWTARYISDPIRDEPKNVGVFVESMGHIEAKFFGERDDGTLDGRRTRGAFPYPDVYAQWRDYWRSSLTTTTLEDLSRVVTPNFYVRFGGEVSDTGHDDLSEVCSFVYSMVVSDGPKEAYQWEIETPAEGALASEVESELSQWRLLDNTPGALLFHPVKKDAPILGAHVTHKPSFSQRNGHLYVMEYIDFSTVRQKSVKERAGWMAFMFGDIKHREATCMNYSIVRPERDTASETLQYARTALSQDSNIINWSDGHERQRFLTERRDVALSVTIAGGNAPVLGP